ncbi:hypothetical protein E0Z10_g5640 [Xylaria hypoxylon]|uniref:MARVEL domain-containing protein n=1 Tax=Xylaria hypoxylon TaxID=37992 RepID=A0A4Z0YUQ6_9PEZI|nr:hypothetical protein E0Z10_g5640 [Xylaria hypoxylon]
MESVKKGETVIPTPSWFLGVRIAQIIFSLIIVALAGYWIHGYYADPLGIAIASGIFTWIIAAYAILTERSAACRSGYNTWAILSLDGLMIILWLASLGANAAYRSTFTVSVNADCYNDGSAINSGHCIISKREAVAGPTGLAVLAAVAGVSVIPLILFVITFAYVAHFFRLEWAKHGSDIEKTSGYAPAPTTASVGQSQPFVNQQQQPQQQQPQWAQQQHQPAVHPTQNTAYDPYAPQQQNTGYAGAQGIYNQTVPQSQEVHGSPYTPQGTPAPGHFYPAQ